MTSRAWGGGREGGASTRSLFCCTIFNVLNRHRKSRARLKNTLRVLSFDVVTELFFFFSSSWSHSCYTLAVFLESYSAEPPPSCSPSPSALWPAVSPCSLRPRALSPRPRPRSPRDRLDTRRGVRDRAACHPHSGDARRRAGTKGGTGLRGDPGRDFSLTSLESGGLAEVGSRSRDMEKWRCFPEDQGCPLARPGRQ
jgi:hypothetical protein